MTERIALVVGTRPEATKVAPVVLACRRRGDLEVHLVCVGQHEHLVVGALAPFGLAPDASIDLDRRRGGIAEMAAQAVDGLSAWLGRSDPAAVVVQGDTATATAGALAAHWEGVPVVHLEAGLRSGNLAAPFPEEGNRRIIAAVARHHLAPTPVAADNLAAEGIPSGRITVIGNTAVDAVLAVTRGVGNPRRSRTIVVTLHRRESWGSRLGRMAGAVAELARRHRHYRFVVPMHPNPIIVDALRHALAGEPNVELVDALGYADFARLLADAHLVLTDSGGVQEEAPTLGVPVLVLRDVTERPEGVVSGSARLIGTEPDRILREASAILGDPDEWSTMADAPNPYGDGGSADRAAQAVAALFGLDTWPTPYVPGSTVAA